MRKIGGYIILIVAIIAFVVKGFRSNIQFANKPTTAAARTAPEQNTRSEAPGAIAGFDRNSTHLILTRHARCRMDCRHINETELKEILHDGSVNYNKSEPQNSRGPKYALEGYTKEHQHLRVIFAPENDGMVVVTCIDLDNEFACGDCK